MIIVTAVMTICWFIISLYFVGLIIAIGIKSYMAKWCTCKEKIILRHKHKDSVFCGYCYKRIRGM